MEKEEKYDFNVCIECQKQGEDIPCDENCPYLEEKNKNKLY